MLWYGSHLPFRIVYTSVKKMEVQAMKNEYVLVDKELRQVIGGAEHTIPLPQQGTDFWQSWNPAVFPEDKNGFIDSNDYFHKLA